jgi:hypothetical protein
MEQTDRVHITRVPGKGTLITVRLTIEADTADPEQMERIGRALRELMPEEDRTALLDELNQAALAAGILTSLEPSH